jgi:hypothetical protein
MDGGGAPARSGPPPCPPTPRTLYQERELSLYIQCPQRYQFETLDGLRAMRDETPYIRFHRCVFRTIGWIEQQRAAGSPADRAAALAQFDSSSTVRAGGRGISH